MTLATEETLRQLLATLTGGTPTPSGGLASNETLAAIVGTALGPLVVAPLGDGRDDGPQITAALARGAVQLVPATYTVATTVLPASGSILYGNGATLNSTIINGGHPSDCAIYIDASSSAAIGSTTLASTPTLPATSVSLAVAPTPGQILAFAHGTSYEVATAGPVTGTGPYTVPLVDEWGLPYALQQPFVSGDAVEFYVADSFPHDIKICGITITGSGVQCVEAARTRNLLFIDCTFAPDDNVTGLGFDEGCVNAWAIRCHAFLGSGTANVGLYAQSNNGGGFIDCKSTGGVNGLMGLDNFGGWSIRGGGGTAMSGYAVLASTLPNGPVASFGCLECVVDGVAAFAVPVGCLVVGARNLVVSNSSFEWCSADGILVTSQSTSPSADGTDVIGCRTDFCGVGILNNIGMLRTRVGSHRANRCTVAALSAAGDIEVNGFTSTISAAVSAGIVTTCAKVCLKNVSLATPSGSVAMQFSGLNGDIWLEDCTVDAPSSVGYYFTAGVGRLKRCKVTAGSSGLAISSGCTVRVDSDCDFDAASTPLNRLSGGFASRGMQITASTSAAFAWPDAKSTDRFGLRLVTASGTPAAQLATYTITPGTGVTWIFPGSDTSLYEVNVA